MAASIISRANIIVVDDEASNVRLLERILQTAGCSRIRTTTDSRQVLSMYLESEPDLVLLDLHMPHMDGFQVMVQLLAALPADAYLPILVLTADVTLETKRRALASGAKDLVTKPLDYSEVILRIKNLLENRFLHLELQKQNELLELQVRERTSQVEETLSKLRATQEHIVKQERLRALGMMASGIAHDFNNALTMVLGYTELLLPYVQAHAPERERGYLLNVMSAAQDATHVVSRLREFYRPATGDEIRLAVDLNEIVKQAVSLTAPRWSAKSLADGVQIDVALELADIPLISAHAVELREVLTNLVFNSVDAMPCGGVITLSTSVHGDTVTLSIRDTGIGMSEEEIQRCLEPFFTTKGDRGTGLGLAVVYGIIQRHGGTIDIVSTKHVGTTLSIRLPKASAAEISHPVTEKCVVRPRRILVVDDQEVICELIAEHLRADGHEVATVTNGIEALDLNSIEAFDLVITDQSMPEMNGTQLAAALRSNSESIRVILLTGFGEEMQALDELPSGVDLVIGKPVSAAELRQAVYSVSAERIPSGRGSPFATRSRHLEEGAANGSMSAVG